MYKTIYAKTFSNDVMFFGHERRENEIIKSLNKDKEELFRHVGVSLVRKISEENKSLDNSEENKS
jgi:hypothetical protein